MTDKKIAAALRYLTLTCRRCGHEWLRRKIERPTVCPNCKSPYWDKPRKTPQ